MLWRYNPIKHQLQYFEIESNRILVFEENFLKALGEAGLWHNISHENLRKLPISTR